MAKKHKKKFHKNLNRAQQAKHRGNTTALLREAINFLKASNAHRALKLAQDAHELATPDEAASARQVLAECYFRATFEGQRIAHPEYLQAALELTPDSPRLFFWLAVADMQAGRWSQALARLESVRALQPERRGLPLLYQLARIMNGKDWQLAQLNDSEAELVRALAAVLMARKSRAREEALPTDKLWLALALLEQDAQGALKLLDELLKQQLGKTARGVLEYYRGVAALRAGQPNAVYACWERARNNGYQSAWFTENQVALRTKELIEMAEKERWRELIKTVNESRLLRTNDLCSELAALAHHHLGYQAAQKDEWRQAVSHWRQATDFVQTCRLAQNLALAEEAMENWEDAAEAWRDMVRRRARKPGNADYLDTNQVVAIWRRAANCYKRDENTQEAITCLKTALKYAGKNSALRLEVVDALMENDQERAAINELRRIIADDANCIDALVRLGGCFINAQEVGEAIELLERARRLDAQHEEARSLLVKAQLFKIGLYQSAAKRAELLEQVLKDIPDDTSLLIELAKTYIKQEKDEKAAPLLLRVCQLAGQDLNALGEALHESLHLSGTESVSEQIFAHTRALATVPVPFWIEQGRAVLNCDLDVNWAHRFHDEALAHAADQKMTRAQVLVEIYMSLTKQSKNKKEQTALRRHYAEKIEKEVPATGAKEYIDAFEAFSSHNQNESRRLLKEARRKAVAAKESYLCEAIDSASQLLSGGGKDPLNSLMRLMERYPKGPPSKREIERMSPNDMFDLLNILGGLPDELLEDFE